MSLSNPVISALAAIGLLAGVGLVFAIVWRAIGAFLDLLFGRRS